MALGTCQFYEGLYVLSSDDTVLQLGIALSEFYGSIIIFCVKAGMKLKTNGIGKGLLT